MFNKTASAPYVASGAHTQLTGLSSAKPILIPTSASGVIVQAITQNVRMRMDGTSPTASMGFQIRAGDPAIYIPSQVGTTLRFIEETASATLEYQLVMAQVE